MPRIIVVSDVAGSDPRILMSEQVAAINLENMHFRGQLAERLTWAVADAENVEEMRPVALTAAGPGIQERPATGRIVSLYEGS